MEKRQRIEELIALLNKASLAYYQEGRELMPNIEYDALYDELLKLEEETGILLPDSPSQNVGSKLISALPKEKHQLPMLSLSKTKSVAELEDWLGDQEGILSWKLDGLTVVLTYREGKLFKAVTRGNGEIGEVITANARTFENLPLQIPYQGELVVRGEAIITYPDFERINREIPDAEARYKNPRNLCSGSVRQLDPKITKQRHVRVVIFALVKKGNTEGTDLADRTEQADRAEQVQQTELATFSGRFEWLKGLGFETVEYELVTEKSLPAAVESFKARIADNAFPSDGLVLSYNDIAYGESLGRTAKFPRNAIAFKWQDETAETVLREVEWSASRTGLINPVAIFDPVELEGTTVSRASVHNLSVIEQLKLGIGDHLLVYKANMIIPQIAENLSCSGNLEIPQVCPACKEKTSIRQDKEAKTLCCDNPDCPAKLLKGFELASSRDALNIEGVSEKLLERFAGLGYLRQKRDLFRLPEHREEIEALEGFGDKSAANLSQAVEKARHTTLSRFLYSLGIAGVGSANAKLLAKHFAQSYDKVKEAGEEELKNIPQIGEVLAKNITGFFADPKKRQEADALYQELFVEPEETSGEAGRSLEGLGFVITGDLTRFSNRRQLTELIEALGGRVLSSVSSKTSFLINNDITSNSSKNRKAKELSVPILTEEEFLSRFGLQGSL